jgi:hypothetical protein
MNAGPIRDCKIRPAQENLRERVADIRKDSIDGSGDLPDAAYCGKSNQGDEQRILHQVLTLLAGHQVADLQIHRKEQVVQLSFSQYLGIRPHLY